MPIRILIAEEQLECCQLFKRFLQRCGYRVTTVHDGIGCIEALNNGVTYDVLILSWELPDEEGEGVLDWLHYHGLDHMSVVILTARMDANYYLQEVAFPDAIWVQRPFSLFELRDAVRSTEPIPRSSSSSSMLEPHLRHSTEPVNGVLFDSHPTTRDLVEQR
ncbi:MAG TPA: response regulator [Planctomycetaceae bacterium]|nr:response regulator [Planctomycetaceae bacterium]